MLSTPAGNNFESASRELQCSNRAQTSTKGPDVLPVSTYLAFWLRELVRRDFIQNRRTFHESTYTYKASLRGVGRSPRGDESWHDTGKKYQSSSSGTRSMRVIPNERNIHSEIYWRSAISFERTRFLVTNRDAILSCLCQYLTSSRLVTNITSGENVTFLDAFYISLGMILCAKASTKRKKVVWNMTSKKQQVVLAYAQQAVYSSNTQCSKQYAAVAASSAASNSSSSTSSPTLTYSKHEHHTTTTTVRSLGPVVAAHHYIS